MLLVNKPGLVNVRFSESKFLLNVLHCVNVWDNDVPVAVVENDLGSVCFSGQKVDVSVI